MQAPVSILIFGHDAQLLMTRRLLLERMGLEARGIDRLDLLRPALTARHFDLLLLCQTLSSAERCAGASLAASLLPGTQVLAMEAGPIGYLACPLAQVLHSSSGPQVFCSTIKALLASTHSSPRHTERKTNMALEGTVAWFNNAKGYGFLGRKDGGADVFAHFSAIQSEGYKSLKQGDEVTFEVIQGEKGPQADQVHLAKRTVDEPAPAA